MVEIKELLQAYNLKGCMIDRLTDTSYRITDGKNIYKLRKSDLTDETITMWKEVYHQAYEKELQAILPVYLTRQQLLYVQVDGAYYYLVPWVDHQEMEHQQQLRALYRLIGRIHARTKQYITFDGQDIANHFTQYGADAKNQEEKLLQHVKNFEKNHYMSPFELLVCTQYRDMSHVVKEIGDSISHFNEQIKMEDEWNYSLCHRNLDFSTLLHHERTYILNWEHAGYQHAVDDLTTLFRHIVRHYDDPVDQYLSFFPIYLEENQLTEVELYLLSIHLLRLADYIKIVESYVKDPERETMVHYIQQLQLAYRQNMFGLQWINTRNELLSTSSEQEQGD